MEVLHWYQHVNPPNSGRLMLMNRRLVMEWLATLNGIDAVRIPDSTLRPS